MVQAGLGAGYAQQIINTRDQRFSLPRRRHPLSPVNLVVRIAFNPNVETSWFTSVMGIINSITMLAIVLSGAAIVREREHGTMDHLLVMPLTPFEIAMAKIWATASSSWWRSAVALSRRCVWLLGIPIAGSIPLFLRRRGGLPVLRDRDRHLSRHAWRARCRSSACSICWSICRCMLSGSNTPLESMPPWLATIMQASPTTHFVSFAQAILYRGAGFAVVWPQFLIVALIGGVFLGLSLWRFRAVAAAPG